MINQTQTNTQPKVSVVVPIYGVEKYLNQCVDSILAQTLKDIEIILVDDGSKDKCPQIVDEYAKKDKRVVAVHQPNGGYGKAVNHGIALAKGEYIGIIESDDWIEKDMYEKLYNNAKENNTDITKTGFYIYNSYNNGNLRNIEWKAKFQDLMDAPETVFNISSYPELLCFHASIWSSIYKADFIKGQKVIESKSSSYQDFPFMCEAYARAKRISVVHDYLVHYRMEEGQNSSTIRRDERLIMMPKQCIEGKNILIKYGKYNELREELYYHSYLACIGFYQNIYWKYKRQYLKTMQELFKDLRKKPITYKYFDNCRRENLEHIIKGHLFRSLFSFKKLRRFLISIHFNHKGFLIQLFGIKIIKGKFTA